MTFTLHQATVFESADDIQRVVRAFRKLGKAIVLIPVADVLHAGHIQHIRLARRIPGSIIIVWVVQLTHTDIETLRNEQVDGIFVMPGTELFPDGVRTLVLPGRDVAQYSEPLTHLLAVLHITQPTDVFLSEKDYELLVHLQHMITDFHMGIIVHGVPHVRETGGLAFDPANTKLSPAGKEAALVISAALIAGAYAAEDGPAAVLAAADAVLGRADTLVRIERLELLGADLGNAPDVGEGRLFIRATVEGIALSDNIGVPLGVGFKSAEAH